MAIRQIVKEGDEILTKKCREVTDFNERLSILIDDMFDTMYEANGAGLAAPQVGILRRIVVIDVGEPIELVNPVILEPVSYTHLKNVRKLFGGNSDTIWLEYTNL